jgi:hypothetical protein
MANPVHLTNLGELATGTDVGGGVKALDVAVKAGSISFTEGAAAADGGALPAQVKVIGGYDGAAVQAIATDASGNLQVDVLTLPALAAGTNQIGHVISDPTSVTSIYNGGNIAGVNASGEVSVVSRQINTLIPVAYDAITFVYNATDDVAQYRTGGAAGAVVATVTTTYTDSSKSVISSVVRT